MGGLGWALLGWCGTKWPGWRPGPKPDPDPEPWWRNLLYGVIGAGAAVVVGQRLGGGFAEAGLIAEAVVAFAAGSVARDITGSAFGAIGQ